MRSYFLLATLTVLFASGCMRASVRDQVEEPDQSKTELQLLEERLGV